MEVQDWILVILGTILALLFLKAKFVVFGIVAGALVLSRSGLAIRDHLRIKRLRRILGLHQKLIG